MGLKVAMELEIQSLNQTQAKVLSFYPVHLLASKIATWVDNKTPLKMASVNFHKSTTNLSFIIIYYYLLSFIIIIYYYFRCMK